MSDENVSTVATDDAPDSRANSADAPPSTVDMVREARKRSAERNAPPAPKEPATAPATTGDEDAPKEGAKQGDPATKPAEETSADFLPDEEFIGKDLRNVDLSKVRPELRETVRKMQTAERRIQEKANAEKRALEDRIKALESRSERSDDSFEDDDLDAAEIARLMKSPKGREIMKAIIREEVGDPDELKRTSEDRILATAIQSAAEKHPELLQDQEFYRETIRAIAEDPDWAEEFESAENDPRKLSRLFRSVAAEVKDARTQAERERDSVKRKKADADLEKLRREREENNAKPGSVAAKAGRRSTANPDEPTSTLDMVKRLRSERGYA